MVSPRAVLSLPPSVNKHFALSELPTTTMSTVSDKHKLATTELALPKRILLGPGPSNIPARVNAKLSAPMVGCIYC
jgi:hypothetical protein